MAIILTGRSTAEASLGDRIGRWALCLVVAVWIGVLALIASHPLFVTHDSMSNYAHVWYVRQHLVHDHRLPWRMPTIGHGQAFAFPYSLVPWVLTALAWSLVGERAVTLALILGFVAAVAAIFWAFPEVRSGWWACAVLLNPILVMAPLKGQLPFLWALAAFTMAIGLWRRGRRGWAAVALALAELTHPAVMIPLAVIGVLLWLPWEPARRPFLKWSAVATAAAIPAAWIVLASPAYTDASTRSVVLGFVNTVLLRALILVVPVAGAVLSRRVPDWFAPALVAVMLVLNAQVKLLDTGAAWAALVNHPATDVRQYVEAGHTENGATYRVLH